MSNTVHSEGGDLAFLFGGLHGIGSKTLAPVPDQLNQYEQIPLCSGYQPPEVLTNPPMKYHKTNLRRSQLMGGCIPILAPRTYLVTGRTYLVAHPWSAPPIATYLDRLGGHRPHMPQRPSCDPVSTKQDHIGTKKDQVPKGFSHI